MPNQDYSSSTPTNGLGPSAGSPVPQRKDSLSEAATPTGQSFEESFSQLERTVQALEAGGLTLEQATTLFQEGMRLAQVCRKMLDATELKVKQLQVDLGQQIRLADGGGNGAC